MPIKRIINYFSTLPPVFIDGTLYVLIGLFTYLQGISASDDAAKYLSAELLFWTKVFIGALLTIWVNLKMFRSTQFAEHQAEKKAKNGGGGTTPPFILGK